jgi:hypothetical protein
MGDQRLPGQGLTDQAGIPRPAPPQRRPKVMSVREFHELGYLEEVNRRVLHPLGLALDVEVSPDGLESFGVVWYCREDPAGVVYPPDHNWSGHSAHLLAEWDRRVAARTSVVGSMVQEAP